MNFEDKVERGYKLLTDEERRILSFIPVGKENCKTARDLEPLTGATQKQLSLVARRALNVGFPVLACRHGFYIATCDADVEAYKRREELRDIGHGKTIAALARFLQA